MLSDSELAKTLLRCDQDVLYFHTISPSVQIELKQYCRELIKYGGITHEMAGGKVFTDNTLLRPAKKLLKSLKKKKE